MKKTAFLLFIVSAITWGQFSQPKANEGILTGGMGLTWIDGNPHYTVRMMPEFGFANFGVGLDLNLEFDSKGKLRKENFNETSDYLSIIRYARYGQKKDPVYVRLGALDYATLGHGTVMYMYNNSPSFDTRKIGLEFDVDFSKFGFESVYGSFGEGGVLGLRGYVRPLQFTDLAAVPVIGNLEVGATFATDFHENAGITAGTLDAEGKLNVTQDEGSLSIIGFDIGLPVVSTGMFNLDLYFDYNKIISFGSGAATGVVASVNGLGLVDVRAKLERRFNGDQYLPSYFNSMYELERFSLAGGAPASKVQILKSTQKIGDGFYGELLVRLLGTFDITGSYQRLDDYPTSGILHLQTDISPEDMSFVARAGYDKVNIQDEKDLFTLDERSYLYAELGYKPMSYLLVSMVYHWTFTPVRDADDRIISYEPQKKIEPRVSFIYPLSF